MLPFPVDVLPLQAHSAADAGPAHGGWATPPPPRRARIASPAGEQDTPSSVSPALEDSSAASSPLVPVLPEPSADNTRRRLRWKQPATPPEVPEEAAADALEARVFVECDWSSWPDVGEDSADGRYWLFRRRLTSWMAEVSQNRAEAPGLVLKAMENFKAMRRVEKHELVSLFNAAVRLPDAVRDWAFLQWPPPDGTGTDAPPQKKAWLYSRSVLLTYQGDWGVLPHDGVPATATADALVEYVAGEPSATALWAEFKGKVDALVAFLRPNDWACSQEICMQTWTDRKGLRVHFHAYFRKDAKMHSQQGEVFLWRGSLPHKVDHALSWITRTQSGFGALYYLVAPKIGSVRHASSKAAFTGFPVNPSWIASLVSMEKMSTTTAREEFVRGGSGLVRRLADLDKLVQCRREAEIERKVRAIQESLKASQFAFHPFPAIDSWRRQAEIPGQRRKKFLILEGGSGLGKTEFVRAMYGADRTLELNCASCGNNPDLRRHDPLTHACILFDEAAPSMILANRKLFQAPATWVDLGHSPTGRDVYRVFLNEAVLVVCSNGWSAQCDGLKLQEDKDWLQQNSVLVVVHGPMYIRDD